MTMPCLVYFCSFIDSELPSVGGGGGRCYDNALSFLYIIVLSLTQSYQVLVVREGDAMTMPCLSCINHCSFIDSELPNVGGRVRCYNNALSLWKYTPVLSLTQSCQV